MSEPTPLPLAFYRTLYPDPLYVVAGSARAAGPVPAEDAPLVAESPQPLAEPPMASPAATPASLPPAAPAEQPAPAAAPASPKPRLVAPPRLPPAPVPPRPLAPPPTPIATTLTPGTTQQSRGDGSAALVVVRLPPADFARLRDEPFWPNLLTALKLDWPVVRFVNVLTPDPLPLPALLALVPAPRVLVFGPTTVAPLPPGVARYQPHPLPDKRALLVADLVGPALDKRALWIGLQTLFGL